MRNLRVFCDMRSTILIVIFRVFFVPFKFRFIAIEAHMIESFIFLSFFRYCVEFGNITVFVTVIIRVLFIIFFRCLINTRGRLRFKNIRLRFKIRRLIKRTRYTCGINFFFKGEQLFVAMCCNKNLISIFNFFNFF
jgi:hypothetical protein